LTLFSEFSGINIIYLDMNGELITTIFNNENPSSIFADEGEFAVDFEGVRTNSTTNISRIYNPASFLRFKKS
jgi:hypothetical protein